MNKVSISDLAPELNYTIQKVITLHTESFHNAGYSDEEIRKAIKKTVYWFANTRECYVSYLGVGFDITCLLCDDDIDDLVYFIYRRIIDDHNKENKEHANI